MTATDDFIEQLHSRIDELEKAITEALPVLAEVDNKVILENAVAYQDRTIDDRYSRAVARLSRALEGET